MRDLLKYLPTVAGPPEGAPDELVAAFRRDREHVNVTLNEQLDFYADAHGVDIGRQVKVGDGYLYGGAKPSDPVVFFLPATQEIGANTRAFAEAYLRDGSMPAELDLARPDVPAPWEEEG